MNSKSVHSNRRPSVASRALTRAARRGCAGPDRGGRDPPRRNSGRCSCAGSCRCRPAKRAAAGGSCLAHQAGPATGMTARPTGCARTSSSLAVSPKQAATLAHASGRCQWRWRHGQLAADAGVVARHTARHAWGYRMNTTTPPAARRGALIFIFVTVVLDMLAFGIIIPVLPKLVEQFLNGDTARAAQVYGVFSMAWAAMQFVRPEEHTSELQ